MRQGDLALTVAQPLGARAALDATVYGSVRTLDNPLTFAVVDVGRSSGGASARLSGDGLARRARRARSPRAAICSGRTTTGRSTRRASTSPRRRRHVPRRDAARRVCARISASSCRASGPFVRGELALAPSLLASAGVRADAVRFRVHDRLITATNPDDSGDRTLHAVSPAFGLVWRTTPLASLYATSRRASRRRRRRSWATSPTARRESIRSSSRSARCRRGGRQGAASRRHAFVGSVAAFQTRARDELVPFDIPGGAGRRYFRNAGRTHAARRRSGGRGGGGTALAATPRTAIRASDTWTTSSAPRRTRASASPACPSTRWPQSAARAPRVVTLSGTADVAERDGRGRREQRPGRREERFSGWRCRTRYGSAGYDCRRSWPCRTSTASRSVGSVSVNATGGKFFEPAPGRTLLVRMALSRDGETLPRSSRAAQPSRHLALRDGRSSSVLGLVRCVRSLVPLQVAPSSALARAATQAPAGPHVAGVGADPVSAAAIVEGRAGRRRAHRHDRRQDDDRAPARAVDAARGTGGRATATSGATSRCSTRRAPSAPRRRWRSAPSPSRCAR